MQREAQEQTDLFNWAFYSKAKYPELDLMYHIPNGGSRNKIEAAHLKRQGVKSGVPDIFLPVARGSWHGLYIELKAGKNKPTGNQKEWILRLREQGYAAEVAVGWIQAKELIEAYLNYDKEKRV